MSKLITNRISLCSIVALSFLGVAANECLAQGSDCTNNGTFNVCVEWSLGFNPVEGTDYDVEFHGTAAPDLALLKGDPGWIVYREEFSNPGTPADIGAFTTPGGDADYVVQIRNGAAAGFANVGSASLVPGGGKSSSIAAGSFIDGNISGALKVVKDTGDSGGVLGGLWVNGDVQGPLMLPRVTGENRIFGTVSELVTIGAIDSGHLTIGEHLLADCHITEGMVVGGFIVYGGVGFTTIRIADMESSWITLGDGYPENSTFNGTLILDEGLADSNSSVTVTAEFQGTIDLTDDAVAGTLLIAQGTGDVVNGGTVSGTVTLGFGNSRTFWGTAAFTSVSSSGTVQTGLPTAEADFDGRLFIGAGTGGAPYGDMDGEIHLARDFGSNGPTAGRIEIGGVVRGEITIDGKVEEGADIWILGKMEGGTLTVKGDVTPVASVFTIADMVSDGGGNPSRIDFQQDFDGSLDLNSGIKAGQEVRIGGEFTSVDSIFLNGKDVAGTLEIVGGGSGSIGSGGAVSGTVILADGAGKTYTGGASFTSVLSGGVIKTLNGADFGGHLNISNDVVGDISVSGDITPSTSSVTIGGKLAAGGVTGAGRVLVTGLCSGDISIGQETATATLIHLLEGLDSGASLVINDGEGNFNANGDIHVGLISCPFSPPDVTYDGCIRIYDEDPTGNTGDYGNLIGELQICGCHNEGDLNICLDGDDNGNVTISQGDCTNQVGWSCGGCP